MQIMKIEELKPHKRNSEFFDDMSGEKWTEFLDSIKTSGVIEPIVITQDKVIVSGHQRVRACKELGIKEILAEIRVYDSEDKIIKDLLETNIRQRGNIGGSTIKLGRRIKELERIYGVRNGSAGKVGSSNGTSKISEQDLAKQLGIDINTLKRAKSLANLSPEVQQLIDDGNISASTAARVIGSKLSKDEQRKFVAMINGDKKYTQKEMDEEIKKWKIKTSELEQQRDDIARQKTKTVVEKIEVDKPETLKRLSDLQSKFNAKIEENKKLADSVLEKQKMINQAIGNSTNYQLTSHCSEITLKMLNFVTEMSKYDYFVDSFNEISIATRMEYKKCVLAVKKWADRVYGSINADVVDNSEFIDV